MSYYSSDLGGLSYANLASRVKKAARASRKNVSARYRLMRCQETNHFEWCVANKLRFFPNTSYREAREYALEMCNETVCKSESSALGEDTVEPTEGPTKESELVDKLTYRGMFIAAGAVAITVLLLRKR